MLKHPFYLFMLIQVGSLASLDYFKIRSLPSKAAFNESVPKRDLEELIWKINNNQNLIFTKYGDGEILCMAGVAGNNCDGDLYHQWLGLSLKKSLFELLQKKDTYLGIWGTPFDKSPDLDYFLYFENLILNQFPNRQMSATIVSYNLMINDDEFYKYPYMHRFVDTLQKTRRKKILVCNVNNRRLASFFKADALITLPPRNWSFEYEKYKNILLQEIEPNAIVIIGGGMCSKVLINEITNTHAVTFLDIGSSFDFLATQRRTRAFDHSFETELDYYKDLIPPEWGY